MDSGLKGAPLTQQPVRESSDRSRAGLLYGLAAYGIWGGFPILFKMLESANPFEVLAHRIIWSLLLCVVALLILRHSFPRAIFTSARSFGLMCVAAVLIAGNWTLYVYGVNTDRVVETALGYFLNPLLSIGLGVVVLGERLRRLQWVAVGLGAVAVVVLSFAAGRLPWIAIGLATLFALYGLVKNRAGKTISALAGLTTETLILLPFACVLLWFFISTDTLVFGNGDTSTSVLLVAVGAFTAIPLLCFAAAASRLPLSVMGMMQYLAPTLQFLVGVFVFHEHMSTLRWVGFTCVWFALCIITWDGLRRRTSPPKS